MSLKQQYRFSPGRHLKVLLVGRSDEHNAKKKNKQTRSKRAKIIHLSKPFDVIQWNESIQCNIISINTQRTEWVWYKVKLVPNKMKYICMIECDSTEIEWYRSGSIKWHIKALIFSKINKRTFQHVLRNLIQKQKHWKTITLCPTDNNC